jgi:hypothetical protein
LVVRGRGYGARVHVEWFDFEIQLNVRGLGFKNTWLVEETRVQFKMLACSSLRAM